MTGVLRIRAVVLAAVVSGATLGAVDAAWATFSSGATTTATYATAGMAAPTALVATCGLTGGIGQVRLAWTPTLSPQVTGYQVWRAINSGRPAVLAAVTGITSVTYTDVVATNLGSLSYFVVATASFSQTTWTSAPSNSVSC